MKTLKDILTEWRNSPTDDSAAKFVYDAMQAYADQQVNRVVDEALLICYKHDGIDNWLELRQKLEKLKIKQP